MAMKWESSEQYMKLEREVDTLLNQLAKSNYLDNTLNELKEITSRFSSDKEGYIVHLIKKDNYLWALYGTFINAFQQKLPNSKYGYEIWYKNQLSSIDEIERNWWEYKVENALPAVQREFGWDQQKIINALESGYVRDKVILELSQSLTFKFIENTALHQDLLNYINNESLAAAAMFGLALNRAADKFLENNGYKQTKISSFEYFELRGYDA